MSLYFELNSAAESDSLGEPPFAANAQPLIESQVTGDIAMTHKLDVAEILVASWILADGEGRIPTSHGILDRALKEAVRDKSCPSQVRDSLSFVDSRIGLQCVELPSLLDWAQRAHLTSAPNPSYQSAQIQISDGAAKELMEDLGIDPDAIKIWGQVLRDHVQNASAAMRSDYAMEIEEY